MGWFDEQIRQRKENDAEAFSDAFAKMAGAVMGKGGRQLLQDDALKQSQSAVEEILSYFRVRPRETAGKYKDLDELLEAQLGPCGVMRRPVTLTQGWYRDGIGVLLGSTRDGDVIALLPRGMGGYRYLDRKTGRYVKVTAGNQDNICRQALCFYRPLPLGKLGVRELMSYLIHVPSGGDLAAIVAAAFAAALLGLFLPQVSQVIFSQVAPSGRMGLLLAAMALLTGVTVSTCLIGVVRTLLVRRVQDKMQVAAQSASMMRVLSLPSDFFRQHSAGDIGSRMNALGTVCALLADGLLSTGLTSIFSLVYLVQIFHFSPALAWPTAVILLLTLAVTAATALVQSRVSRQKLEEQAREQGMVYSMLTGIQKIKLAGAEKRMFARWADQYVKSARLSYDPPALVKYSSALTAAISLLGTVALYGAALAGSVEVADYMAFQSSYGLITGAFAALSAAAFTVANIRPILELSRPILEAKPEISGSKPRVDRLSGGVELSHITFRYSPDMPPVVDDLSLKIRSGEYVAIVGATGCGKSTLMRLMLGFETPQKGAVYYDGRDLARLDLKSVRQKIGVVMQQGKLFQGDIYSNIALAAPGLTLEEAWQAAQLAGMADDIRRMPMGMQTLISEGSGGISGGQRQRLLIARAIAPRPRILMFDEATSALDNLTQQRVTQSLDGLKCTRIVIAHRLSTIRQCDRIVVLDGGKIVEDGTYEQLLAQGGLFAQLVERQRLDGAPPVGQAAPEPV